MFKNVKALLEKGVFNCFDCGKDNYLFTYSTGSDFMYIPLVSNALTSIAYIDVSDDIVTPLEDSLIYFFANDAKAFFNLPKNITCKTKSQPLSPLFTKLISRITPKKGSLLDLNFFKARFDADGIDYSLLIFTVVSTFRNFTSSTTNDYGKSLIDSNKSVFTSFTPDFNNLPSALKLVYNDIKYNRKFFFTFVGAPGTGKSIFARQLAYLFNVPLIPTQFTEGLTVDDLLGKPIVNTDDNSSVYKYIVGPLLTAYENGWFFLADEVNMALNSVTNVFNSITDATPQIEYNGKIYKRHPNFCLFFTMNAGMEGTNTLNGALKTRTSVVQIPELTKDLFISRLQSYVDNVLHSSLSPNFYSELFTFNSYMITLSKGFAESVFFCLRNAQHLCESILNTPLDLDMFSEAVYQSYFNYLSMDNDNINLLETAKFTTDTVSRISKLFKFYDFKVVPTVDISSVSITDDELFGNSLDDIVSSKVTNDSVSSLNADTLISSDDLSALDEILNAASVSTNTAKPGLGSSKSSSPASEETLEDSLTEEECE